ncbi:MAG TPA: ligase-associated DNA damage response exonuclease [Candidatus Paceibacterota bacterium]|nr:ligase-associated DNA damage response exonuclease [Verrucomicrobiota bacterium]HOX03573.1 ligase-associated DNA damage response exonuclease [Verrucomicrobiota bacterium]HRZ46462.1 ligase-associated DNA damage response exonuclease [Candidatus Paceibacterota bacterium]HRZ91913.1 ligase-associated DNA damage response exonuclease [Candidatus Paceibacterota bacterium]
MTAPLIEPTPRGLYCRAGDFYLDPSRPVARAVITHGHSDHAFPGHGAYLCAEPGVAILRQRLGARASIAGLSYGTSRDCGGVRISLHPAGHILGSAQVRLEHRGEVWVCSGDYKLDSDPTCAPFEPVRCHTFITESTFGLPVYRWPRPALVAAQINGWWRGNRAAGVSSLLFAYSLGKAQRILASIDPSLGPILAHPSILQFYPAYETAGVALPAVDPATADRVRAASGRALVLVPPAAAESLAGWDPGPAALGCASGWMLLRAARRRGGFDGGFVLSDHADWPGLQSAIAATGAEQVLVTHGCAAPVARWLCETGRHARLLETASDWHSADDEPIPPGND